MLRVLLIIWRVKMFKPHIGICSCHGKRRMIVVKAGLCKEGNEFRKGKDFKTVCVKSVSAKRQKLDRKYFKLRTIFLNKHSACEFKDCQHYSTDVHHKRGRGIYYLDCSTWMAVCRNHHTWIETHPKESYELGYSELRLAK